MINTSSNARVALSRSTPTRRGPIEGIARLWRQVRLLDVVVLTSVPLLAIVLLIGSGVISAFQYAEFDDWWTEGVTVRSLVRARASAMMTVPSRVALRQHFAVDAPDPGIVRIEIPQQDWEKMHGDSQAMWGEWLDGILTYGGTSLDVRLRKRGDNSIHWLTDKRSFTVRTTRQEFYKSYREFSLSVRSPLASYLAGRLAQEFDLLAPDVVVVPVYLNNEFYGMFLLREVVDEFFLRRVGQMPGNIYRGDAAERAEARKGTPRNLFVNPYIWDRVVSDDRWTAAPTDGLQRMLEDLVGGTFEDHQRLIARFDLDEYARLVAFYMVVGDPYHHSNVNNHFIYEDPSTALLHPIAWDLRIRNLTDREPAFNDLFRALSRNPWLTDRILQEAAKSVSERHIDAVADRIVTEAETRYREYFEYDTLRGGTVPYMGTAAQWREMVRANVQTIRQWLSRDQVAVGMASDGRSRVIDVETRGLVGVNLVALEGLSPSDRPRLYRDRNQNGVLDKDDPEVPAHVDGRTLVLDSPLPLLAAWDTSKAGFDAGRLSYRLFATDVTSELRPLMKNRVTGEPPSTVTLQNGQAMAVSTAWHPWRYPERSPVTHRFSGDVHLSQTMRIAEGDTVIVESGTTFRMDPDVSFISKGVVRFEGTVERPIRVVPAVPNRPWGAFSLLGRGADGSVVRHAEFSEGAGGLVDRVAYVGMVNVHRARNVVFDSVKLSRNRVGEDAFHALHADVALTNSQLLDSNAVAIDFDASTGEIRGNTIEGGSNAIDLTMSAPRVIDNRIRRVVHSGISVGRVSAPVVFANVIENSAIGIDIKDGASPILVNNEIRGAALGLRSKASDGGSGVPFIANLRLVKNATAVDSDSTSRATTTGLDDLDEIATEASTPAPLAWLYRRLGIEIDKTTLGVPHTWRAVTPIPPAEEFRFTDDFESTNDGWVGDARVTGPEKRQGALVFDAKGGTGSISRQVDWSLDSAAGGVLVLELAGRDVQRVHIEVDGRLDRISRDVSVAADQTLFSVVELPLPRDHYSRLTVRLEPIAGLSQIQETTGLSVLRAGRLFLHSVAVYATPPGDDTAGEVSQ
jgi:hypothetical protein